MLTLSALLNPRTKQNSPEYLLNQILVASRIWKSYWLKPKRVILIYQSILCLNEAHLKKRTAKKGLRDLSKLVISKELTCSCGSFWLGWEAHLMTPAFHDQSPTRLILGLDPPLTSRNRLPIKSSLPILSSDAAHVPVGGAFEGFDGILWSLIQNYQVLVDDLWAQTSWNVFPFFQIRFTKNFILQISRVFAIFYWNCRLRCSQHKYMGWNSSNFQLKTDQAVIWSQHVSKNFYSSSWNTSCAYWSHCCGCQCQVMPCEGAIKGSSKIERLVALPSELDLRFFASYAIK